MKIKDTILLTFGSLFIGWVILHAGPKTLTQEQPRVQKDTFKNVKGKKALFIGDSHTANYQFGWQKQLSDSVGFISANASEIGKTTYWMLNMAVYRLSKDFNYCFVYGGANDMYASHIAVEEAINNLRGIAKICSKLGIQCVILTGFDPVTCTRTNNTRYAYRYASLQRKLMTEYMEGAIVVDTRVVARTDCWDGLCHMKLAGHRKIAEKIINNLKLKKK